MPWNIISTTTITRRKAEMLRTLVLVTILVIHRSNAFSLTNNVQLSPSLTYNAGGTASHSAFCGSGMRLCPGRKTQGQHGSKSSLGMFLGNDGIFGVGAPEVALITLVGYFLLGPEDLYKVVKEGGKLLNQVRTLGTETAKQFEDSMEDQLNISELRETQRELNDAFNFRRSINTDEKIDFNEVPEEKENAVEEKPAAATGKKRVRKRVKKKNRLVEEEEIEGNIEDIDLTSAFEEQEAQRAENRASNEEQAIRQERMSRLEGSPAIPDNDFWGNAGELDVADEVLSQQGRTPDEQSRFAAQLSGNWNDSILANQDKLQPLGKVMERLAILEQEREADTLRLEEEFRMRAKIDEDFYKRKRTILEETAAEIQANAYATTEETSLDEMKVVHSTNTTAESANVPARGNDYLSNL